jgi:hypothetical protein
LSAPHRAPLSILLCAGSLLGGVAEAIPGSAFEVVAPSGAEVSDC